MKFFKSIFLTILLFSLPQIAMTEDGDQFNRGATASASGALTTLLSRQQVNSIRRQHAVVDFDVPEGRAIHDFDRVRIVNQAELGSVVRLELLASPEESRRITLGQLEAERARTETRLARANEFLGVAPDADARIYAANEALGAQERLRQIDGTMESLRTRPLHQITRLPESITIQVDPLFPDDISNYMRKAQARGSSLVKVERFTAEGFHYLRRFRALGAMGIVAAGAGGYLMLTADDERPEQTYIEENSEIIESFEPSSQ